MLVCPTACALPPVIAPMGLLTGLVHVYNVPAGMTFPGVAAEGVTEKLEPLHILEGMSWMNGIGLTVTVTVKLAPVQLPLAPDVGVTV